MHNRDNKSSGDSTTAWVPSDHVDFSATCTWPSGSRHIIMDRDPLFTHAFRPMLAASGVRRVRSPARSPNLNAFAERFVRSVRDECLAKVIPLGENHLRELLREYLAQYHAERNHQGLDNALIEP